MRILLPKNVLFVALVKCDYSGSYLAKPVMCGHPTLQLTETVHSNTYNKNNTTDTFQQ